MIYSPTSNKTDASISGLVIDNSGNLLNNAMVCLLIDVTSNIYRCTYTDENGEYTMSSQVGTYKVSAAKNGYTAKFQNTEITEGKESFVVFILHKESLPSSEQSLIDIELLYNYVIEDTVQNNNAGVILNVEENKIMILIDDLTSSFEESDSDNAVKFKISAPDGTSSKIIFVKATDETFSDIQNLNDFKVKFDDSEIERKSLDEILNFDDDSVAYAIFTSINEKNENAYYFAIKTTFSEHTFEIYTITHSLPEVLSGIIALSYNLIFIAIIAVIVIGSIIMRIRRS